MASGSTASRASKVKLKKRKAKAAPTPAAPVPKKPRQSTTTSNIKATVNSMEIISNSDVPTIGPSDPKPIVKGSSSDSLQTLVCTISIHSHIRS